MNYKLFNKIHSHLNLIQYSMINKDVFIFSSQECFHNATVFKVRCFVAQPCPQELRFSLRLRNKMLTEVLQTITNNTNINITFVCFSFQIRWRFRPTVVFILCIFRILKVSKETWLTQKLWIPWWTPTTTKLCRSRSKPSCGSR